MKVESTFACIYTYNEMAFGIIERGIYTLNLGRDGFLHIYHGGHLAVYSDCYLRYYTNDNPIGD